MRHIARLFAAAGLLILGAAWAPSATAQDYCTSPVDINCDNPLFWSYCRVWVADPQDRHPWVCVGHDFSLCAWLAFDRCDALNRTANGIHVVLPDP